jgi:hypothetical protein
MLEGFAVQDFINQSEHDGSIAVESPYNSDQCKDDTIDFNKVMVAHRFSAELLRSKSILRISHQKEHFVQGERESNETPRTIYAKRYGHSFMKKTD